MKGYCYIALIIGFFVFFQQSPVYAIVIIVLFAGVYLFFKSRKSGAKGSGFGLFAGKSTQQESRMDDLITLMMIQQLMNSSSHPEDSRLYEEQAIERQKQVEKTRKEVLDLLEDD